MRKTNSSIDNEVDQDSGHAPGRRCTNAGFGDRKSLSTNLAPLKRWLASQVNRPCHKAYAEICANINWRDTGQEHFFTHMSDFVAFDTRLPLEVGAVLAPVLR